ncbi:MAG: hypothetical protein FJ405_11975 [Verrucomicrobia bacterium]|nr:hypothetical protein [Verrucomicrobiota bacterium]
MHSPISKSLLTCGCAVLTLFSWTNSAAAAHDPDQWPSVVDPSKTAHFVSVDQFLAPPGETWTETLKVLDGGDQTTARIALRNRVGLKATSS